ncbi:hypothetical protein QF034_000592 [Streptomyces africanus]|uniref:Integral membrane protein n=1 Tax=Streptomyces africanus TaxID=231024 RepID=A0ABU0QG45_9ACTN|nr:hypothetical protein [Streptomyces africanus]MDQ0746361.1 hypothetical protein [Streptomyces africanus]
MTAGRCARTIRAAVFAAVCVVLAALGHVMMSGDQVPLRTLLAGWAVTGVAGWCLAGRERGLRLVVAVAVAVQTALHSAFSLVPSAPDSMHMGTSGTASIGHGVGSAEPMRTSMPTPMPISEHMGHAGHTPGGDSSLGMLAAHLLAALLCGLWLGHGERAVFRLLRAVGGRLAAPLRLLFALPAPPPPPVRVRWWSSDRAPRLLLLVHAITSRGPPVRAAAV